MQEIFDAFITSYIKDEIGICENLFSHELALHLQENIIQLNAADLMKPAGIGNEQIVNHDLLIRKDKIYWLDRKNENLFENAFLNIIDQFIIYLNTTCYTGITGYEFHYAIYEKGSFYKKHLDQFSNNKSRKFSLIFYLNTEWVIADGGELRVYTTPPTQDIAPTFGKCIFFKSDTLLHEVLLSNNIRMSITGWLKNDA